MIYMETGFIGAVYRAYVRLRHLGFRGVGLKNWGLGTGFNGYRLDGYDPSEGVRFSRTCWEHRKTQGIGPLNLEPRTVNPVRVGTYQVKSSLKGDYIGDYIRDYYRGY